MVGFADDLELFVGGGVVRVLVWAGGLVRMDEVLSRMRMGCTRVKFDGLFSVGLFDLNLGRCGRDAQSVVVGRFEDHLGWCQAEEDAVG